MRTSLFELILSDESLNEVGDTQVCCPFPHLTSDGKEYFETRPSAGVNLEKGVFHCFSCGRAYNEMQFFAAYMGISNKQAHQLSQSLNTIHNRNSWRKTGVFNLQNNQQIQQKIHALGISDDVVKQLDIGTSKGDAIEFPVLLFDQMIDKIEYRPNETPKIKRQFGSKSGMIIPFDLWLHNSKITLICAGEKDMAIARTYGFNAITITGGEGTIPEYFLNFFKDRVVRIIYDNDEAGRNGARKVATFLKPVTKSVAVVDLSATCTEKGEDLHDFFIKYNKTREDLIELMKSTPEFTEEEYEKERNENIPLITLAQASNPKYANRVVRSDIQVLSTFENQFRLATILHAQKYKDDPDGTLKNGESRLWFYDEKIANQLLMLLDSGLKEANIKNYRKEVLLGIPKGEKYINIKEDEIKTVYKTLVSDTIASEDELYSMDAQPQGEFLAYSVGHRLENGKKYEITYRIVPHPLNGQVLTLIIFDISEPQDETKNFKVTPEVIENLKKFQTLPTVEERINDNVQKVKGLVKGDYNEVLIKLIDLWFHSVLFFNVGDQQNVKGALDVLLVGESRTGKSHTAETLAKTYGKGKKVSMVETTVQALVGGTQKDTRGANQIRAGIIPMHHTGALILEELSKSKDGPEVLKKLTEIKSSGITRVGRVSGTLELPSVVRFLSISNTRTFGATSKPISSYPNGISVLTDLIGTAEDIARLDIAAVFSDMANKDIDPNFKAPIPHSKEAYQARINWVWSRKPENIIIDEETRIHLIQVSNKLKNEYNSHIKLFGTETWKKLARLAIAIAGYTVQTDDYENLIVSKECIDYASAYLVSLYDNDTFRLRQYVEEERRYRDVTPKDVELIADLFNAHRTIIEELELSSNTTRANLESVSGYLDRADLNNLISTLRAAGFIRLDGYSIIPTEKFRKAMKQIDRETVIKALPKVVLK